MATKITLELETTLPLLVDAVEALRDAARSCGSATDNELEWLAGQIEAQLPKPVPEEPTGDVLVDVGGELLRPRPPHWMPCAGHTNNPPTWAELAPAAEADPLEALVQRLVGALWSGVDNNQEVWAREIRDFAERVRALATEDTATKAITEQHVNAAYWAFGELPPCPTVAQVKEALRRSLQAALAPEAGL